MREPIADTLRTAVETGDGSGIRDRLAPGAAVHTSTESGRRVLGAAAALHRTFRGRELPGAARIVDRIGMSPPAVADAERTARERLGGAPA